MIELKKSCLNKLSGMEVLLPSSKSISNRLLVIQSLAVLQNEIENLSKSNDTLLLKKVLMNENSVYFNFEDAGTPYRFFTSVAALKYPSFVLDAHEGLKKRPIKGLVDALKQLGAEISYLEEEGFPPIKIEKTIDLSSTHLQLEVSLSSQFLSSLLLISPLFDDGLTLSFNQKMVSKPYVDMTISVMRNYGITVEEQENAIMVSKGEYKMLQPYTVEADWSSAAFLFGFLSLSESHEMLFPSLTLNSSQGDRAIVAIFEKFGVFCTETENGLRVQKQMNAVPDGLEVDFTDIPDAFPLVLACCVAHQVNAEFTGIKNLKFKESDRVSAMIDNLLPLGLRVLEQTEDTIRIDSSGIKTLETYNIKSYNDHRIAMACSLFVLKGNIVIDNERVVNKSFPDYWQVLEGLLVGV